jgi:hypothetical protein
MGVRVRWIDGAHNNVCSMCLLCSLSLSLSLSLPLRCLTHTLFPLSLSPSGQKRGAEDRDAEEERATKKQHVKQSTTGSSA